MAKRFSKPIPGMSLTQTPKNAPWERAPEITKPEKAIEYHLNKMSNPDTMEKALYLLESDRITLVNLVQGLMRGATYQGIHSVDVGLLVAPVVHEFIKQTADSVGITYDEGFEDKSKKEKELQIKVSEKARKLLRQADFDIPEIDRAEVEAAGEAAPMVGPDQVAEEPAVEVTEEAPQPKRGLMARGGM